MTLKKYFLFLPLLIVLFAGCKKEIFHPIEKGQVALTFDDYNVDNWFSYLPLLDSLKIRATFYVCRYHELKPAQKQKLQQIQSAGHEIAYHTTTHPDLVKMLKQKGMAAIINDEIKQDLSLMRRDGFDVKNFAYPFGSHNMQLNSALKKYFKTIRLVCNKTNWNKSLVKQCGDLQILYGAGIDQSSRLSEPGIAGLLDAARKNDDCVVLTAHEINTAPYQFHVSVNRLKWIAAEAKARDLTFVTIDEIK